MDVIEQQLAEIRRELEAIRKKLNEPAAPQRLFSLPAAAKILGFKLTKLKTLIRAGLVHVSRPGGIGHPMISITEIDRLAAPIEQTRRRAPPRPRRSKKSTAEMVANVRAELKKRR